MRQHEIYFVVLLFVSCKGMLKTHLFSCNVNIGSLPIGVDSMTKLETFIDHLSQIDFNPTAVS